MFEAVRLHTELKALQETDGIESYHDQFELIRTRFTLPEDYLVSAYLAGLCTDTQMNVRMFNPQSIRQCLMIGKLYESAHPRQPRNSEKRSVPQETEFSAPTFLHTSSSIRKADEPLGPTIAEDLDANLTQISAKFNNGIAKLSEFIKLGDQDSQEVLTDMEQNSDTQPNTICEGIEKESISFPLNWCEADLKDKLQQFDNPPPFQQGIEMSPTVEQDVLRECPNNFVKPHVQVDGSLGSVLAGWESQPSIEDQLQIGYQHQFQRSITATTLLVGSIKSSSVNSLYSAPQLFDEMSKGDFKDFRPLKVKCAIVSAGVGMNSALGTLYAHQLFDKMPSRTIVIFDTSVDEEFTLGGVWLLFAIYAPYDRGKVKHSHGFGDMLLVVLQRMTFTSSRSLILLELILFCCIWVFSWLHLGFMVQLMGFRWHICGCLQKGLTTEAHEVVCICWNSCVITQGWKLFFAVLWCCCFLLLLWCAALWIFVALCMLSFAEFSRW